MLCGGICWEEMPEKVQVWEQGGMHLFVHHAGLAVQPPKPRFFAGTRYEVRGFLNFAGKHCEGALAVIAATAAAAAAASCA